MPDRLHVEGDWPGPVTIRRGWARAQARPWNDDGPEAAIRLIRGSPEFLSAASSHLVGSGTGDVFSPALYPSATGVWDRAGFVAHRELTVMERVLDDTISSPGHEVTRVRDPDWPDLARIDRDSFEGFWRMSALGLAEAMKATPRSALFQVEAAAGLAGYAIVGCQLAGSYLQRVAVVPTQAGQGLGTALIRACLLWARGRGARSTVLNVRPDNERAASIYAREGFLDTGVSLRVLRFAP